MCWKWELGLQMDQDGCCAVYEDCSDHQAGFIGIVAILVLMAAVMVIAIVYCVHRYLEGKKMKQQLSKEACGIEDLY